MSNSSTTLTVKAKRVLPVALTEEQYGTLIAGDKVLNRESGIVYQVTEVPAGEKIKGRALKDGKPFGPTRPLSREALSVFTETAEATEAPATETAPAVVTEPKAEPEAKTEAPKAKARKVKSAPKSEEAEAIAAVGAAAVKADAAPIPEAPKTETKAADAPKEEEKFEDPAWNIYRLDNGEEVRFEKWTQADIDRKNANREAKGFTGRWTLFTDELPEGVQVFDKRLLVVGKEREEAYQKGFAKDQADHEKRENARAARDGKSTRAVLKDDTADGEKPKAEKKAAAARPEWNGLGMCEIIRYGGSQGWSKKVIAAVCEKVGFKPSTTTVHIQSKKGKDGEQVPELDKSAAKELGAYAVELSAQLDK